MNDEVKRGLALALAADSTLAWRANQAITALKIDFDTVNAVLFDELGKGQNIFGIVSAIAGNLHKASYPLEVLRAALARPSHQLERNLWLLIDTLFPRMANSAKELADLMRQAAETSSGSLKEQAIYGIGELLKYDDAIARMCCARLALKKQTGLSAVNGLWKGPAGSTSGGVLLNTLLKLIRFSQW